MPVYKNSKRNSWYCSFYYTDWTGTRKRKKKEGFATKKEAKDYETAFIVKNKGCCSMSFADLAELYLEDCRERCKPTSFYEKKYLIEKKILPYFKDLPVNEIKVSTIRHWENVLLSYRNQKGNPYSATYLNSIYVQISSILNYAMKYYNLSSNPAALCGSIGKKKAAPMQFWTLEEFRRFLEAISDNIVSETVFQLLFWTGIRSGELLALSLKDFDLKSKMLYITKNYCRLQKKDLILNPKTPKSTRSIALPDFLCDIIRKYICTLKDYREEERLFPITKHYLNAEMDRGCKAAGIKKIRIHDLRHSHASLLIELGYSPLLISERLGHEKIETTLQTYSHLYPDKQTMLARQLESIYNGTF